MIPILMTTNAIYEYFTNVWLIKAPYNVGDYFGWSSRRELFNVIAARAAGVTSMSEIDTETPLVLTSARIMRPALAT